MQVAVTIRVLSGSLLEKNSIDTSKAPIELANASGARILGYGGKRCLNLSLKNTGLITVEPKITAVVDSIFSGRIEEIPVIEGYVMPGQNRIYKIAVTSSSAFDIRTIRYEYKYQYADKVFKGNCSFTYGVVSYQMFLGLFILLVGVIWQTMLFRNRNKLLRQLIAQNNAIADAAKISERSNDAK